MFTQAAALAAIEAGYFLGLLEDTILATDRGRRVCTQGAQTIIREPERRTAEQLARAKSRHPQPARGPRYYAELGGGLVASRWTRSSSTPTGSRGGHDGVDLHLRGRRRRSTRSATRASSTSAPPAGGASGAQASHGHPISDGDGIIQIECIVDKGPFKKGMHFGYGHAEKAVVRAGQLVKAGQKLGHAGFANAWHLHFMVNGGDTERGVGDRDPMPFVTFAASAA